MSAVCLSAVCIAPYRRISSRCSLLLVCDLSLLKRRVFPIASHLAPRPVIPSCSCRHVRRMPVFSSVGALRSSSFASVRPRFSPIVPPFSDSPPNRHAWRGEERGGGGLLGGSCYMSSCGVICSAFSLYVSYSCYISSVLVIYLVFLLYVRRSCYISRILVVCRLFLLYVSYSCYINLFRVILFCRDNAIMGRCV